MSMSALYQCPDFAKDPCGTAHIDWLCEGKKRCYHYCFAIGSAVHVLCIFLAMSFVNVLNESARDSDVYRLFSDGKGFYATVKCQWCFTIGCAADILALIAVMQHFLGWEVIAVTVLLTTIMGLVYI